MGRLFDAVAALCGIRAEVNYEGQAAVELEACCDAGERGAYPFPLLDEGGGPLVMDARPAVAAIARELSRGSRVPLVAARFHNAVAEVTAQGCVRAAERGEHGARGALRGRLPESPPARATSALLGAAGLRVLLPERLPANDGGIAYGQLAVAAAREAAGEGPFTRDRLRTRRTRERSWPRRCSPGDRPSRLPS